MPASGRIRAGILRQLQPFFGDLEPVFLVERIQGALGLLPAVVRRCVEIRLRGKLRSWSSCWHVAHPFPKLGALALGEPGLLPLSPHWASGCVGILRECERPPGSKPTASPDELPEKYAGSVHRRINARTAILFRKRPSHRECGVGISPTVPPRVQLPHGRFPMVRYFKADLRPDLHEQPSTGSARIPRIDRGRPAIVL
jgi:hypothetical protein